MSKFLRISSGDYTVQAPGSIVLDPGYDPQNLNNNLGTVYIKGSLEVSGETVTINNENLEISDNIIVVNKGETSNGISPSNNQQAGIQIDRGSESDTQILFDETIEWSDPVTSLTTFGAFVLKDQADSLIGLRTNSITTGGSDLYLISKGEGVVSVTGTTDYERKIFTYDSGGTINITGGPASNGVVDDDHIPNTKAVVDYVEEYFNVNNRDLIIEEDTKVEVFDDSVTGNPSNIDFSVNTQTVANISESRFRVYNIDISNDTVSTTSIDNDLNLVTSGEGTVKISNVMEFDKRSAAPTTGTDSIKVYGSDVGPGDSGVYYKNDNGKSDELISRNRALLYSMVI